MMSLTNIVIDEDRESVSVSPDYLPWSSLHDAPVGVVGWFLG